MNFDPHIRNALNAIMNKDAEKLTLALGGLTQLPAALRSPILASSLRECIYLAFNEGVSAVLKAGGEPCVADLSLAIQERQAEIVRLLLTPKTLEKLAGNLSTRSFEFAYQQIEPPHWNDYKNANSQFSAECQTRAALWMASKMEAQFKRNPDKP